jgi:hypothetical protein
MNFHDKQFFRNLKISDHVKSLYFKGKRYDREQILKIKDKIKKQENKSYRENGCSCTFSPFIYTVNPYTKQPSVSSITSLT